MTVPLSVGVRVLLCHDGIVLSGVSSGGPADKAGVKPGDVILAINGHFLYTAAELSREIRSITPGTSVAVSLHEAIHHL